MTKTAMLVHAEQRQVHRIAAAVRHQILDADTPLAHLKARANAGPHATALASLQAAVAQRAATVRSGLPDGLRAGLESLSGRDLSGISVHYNSPRPAQLNAHAYAQGSEIHVAPGKERHLPHEGWHAVQQIAGRVKPTMSLGGTPVNDSVHLEREADVMGARAVDAGNAIQRPTSRSMGAGPRKIGSTHAAQLNGKDKAGKIEHPGRQEEIQKKMSSVVEMYASMHGEQLVPNFREEMKNGLCGGWVEIFKKYPAWIEELWEVMKDWKVPRRWERDGPEEALRSLNQLIERYSTRASGLKSRANEEPYLEVIKLLREAWEEMAVLEPEENYDMDLMPSFTERIASDRGTAVERKLKQTVPDKLTLKPAEYATEKIKTYANQNKKHKQLEFVAHIETPEHHMAVRVKRTATSLTITVVETEQLGIAAAYSWDQLQTYLSGGFYVGEKDRSKPETVDIKFFS